MNQYRGEREKERERGWKSERTLSSKQDRTGLLFLVGFIGLAADPNCLMHEWARALEMVVMVRCVNL
ncbi:uncharacterized protein V6R79_013380 [Siganus canaliculatus]